MTFEKENFYMFQYIFHKSFGEQYGNDKELPMIGVIYKGEDFLLIANKSGKPFAKIYKNTDVELLA